MIKKKVFMLVLLLILLSGCNVKRIDKYSNEQILDTVLSLNIKNYNKIGNGYKYYTPKGVIRVDSNNYNDILKRGDNLYYLYVDIVGYYYKKDFEYESEDIYISKELNYKNKKGYIKVKKEKKKLYVQMFYNYAKIETYIDEKDLKDVIIDMSYVLNSLNFNDILLNKMYEQGNLSSNEEVFKLFENKEKEGNFLEYIKEFDKYDSNESEEKEIKVEKSETTKSSDDSSKTTTTKEEQTTTSSKVE